MYKLLFLFAMLGSFTLSAQDNNPVKWTFSVQKGSEANQYILKAVANVPEGFHVFAPDPGGDGLLIPTEITFTTTGIKTGPMIAQRKPITKEMKGIGFVNYYEGEIEFTVTVEGSKLTKLVGQVTSQCCNDNMCLPPADSPFNIKL